jgi:hypothetical protein
MLQVYNPLTKLVAPGAGDAQSDGHFAAEAIIADGSMEAGLLMPVSMVLDVGVSKYMYRLLMLTPVLPKAESIASFFKTLTIASDTFDERK